MGGYNQSMKEQRTLCFDRGMRNRFVGMFDIEKPWKTQLI